MSRIPGFTAEASACGWGEGCHLSFKNKNPDHSKGPLEPAAVRPDLLCDLLPRSEWRILCRALVDIFGPGGFGT
jgi:hypothetical protein